MTEPQFIRACRSCVRRGIVTPLTWFLVQNAERCCCPVHGRRWDWCVIDVDTGRVLLTATATLWRPKSAA